MILELFLYLEINYWILLLLLTEKWAVTLFSQTSEPVL
jgi:hypothetical protein